MGTKRNPGRFDCYAKAEPDEPLFVLLARDPTAALTVTIWMKLRDLRRRAGPHRVEDAEQIEEAREIARAMETWASEHGRDEPRVQEIFEEMILDCADVIRARREGARADAGS